MRILAIKLRAIGDTVIWTSALAALRAQFPDADIVVMTYASNAAVLQNSSDINGFYFLKDKSRGELLRSLWHQRGSKYDWLLGFHATTSLARWAWLAGAKRVALHHHSWTYTPRGSVAIPSAGRLEDAIARDYRVLHAVDPGAEWPRLDTRIQVSDEEAERAEREVSLAVAAVGGDINKKRLAFLPGAGHFLRRYPKDLWLKVVERALARGEYQPVVLADRVVSDEWDLPEVCSRLNVPLFDKGSLRDFIRQVSRCERAFANDSGPGHMAVALGLRTTFVFGPGCVGDWHPYDKQRHPVLRADVPCRAVGPVDQEAFRYCTVDRCEHHSCMRLVVPN